MGEATRVRTTNRMSRAYYSASVADFEATADDALVGALVGASSFAIETAQRDAWREQIGIMRQALRDLPKEGWIAFEFAVPRMGKRIDVLLVSGAAIFVLEFKVGEREFSAEGLRQVWDYALDLKNFHSTSHLAKVVPVLIATAAQAVEAIATPEEDHDGVVRPIRATPALLGALVHGVGWRRDGQAIDSARWLGGSYRPTPTIIEAARALYSGHQVEEITRREADAINLAQTSALIEGVIAEARLTRRKIICFVTGVPGAGKTLVGLDVATKHHDRASELFSVFLSGNGPLVKVLCEALARDRLAHARAANDRLTLGEARSQVRAFIQNVHHFRDECLRDGAKPPIEHVALFDEAQRAWDLRQTANFMRRKKGHATFDMSEPEFLVSCMDRHTDWAVIVCLVGGGQEINTGEAGIAEWIRAIRSKFAHWHVCISPNLRDAEYAAGDAIGMLGGRVQVRTDESLHLRVSMRSFRAEHVSGWVKAVLDVDRQAAASSLDRFRDRYRVVLTRSVETARVWLRSRARGNERYGLMVSSQAQRLKPHAIDVRVEVDPVHWFLHGREDVRSSYYLEDAATEFHVQGLELDWVGVVWDADFRFAPPGWQHWSFRGSRWQRINQLQRQTYLKNAYRVLLTRARQGMVIVVPPGDPTDLTRLPALYQPTFDYLRALGPQVLA